MLHHVQQHRTSRLHQEHNNSTFSWIGLFWVVHKGHDKVTSMSYAIKTINLEILIDLTPDQVEVVVKTFIREQQVKLPIHDV